MSLHSESILASLDSFQSLANATEDGLLAVSSLLWTSVGLGSIGLSLCVACPHQENPDTHPGLETEFLPCLCVTCLGSENGCHWGPPGLYPCLKE